MFCKQCDKGVLIRQYRIVNSIFYIDKYIDSLEKAENFYVDMLEYYPNVGWKLYELLICSDCDYVGEKIWKRERVEEIGNA